MSERHLMRRIREVLRLRFERKLSHREISAAVGISKGSVFDYLARAEAARLDWATASQLSEDDVERRLFRVLGRNEPPERAPIDFEWVHGELRKLGVTLQQLWVEYREAAECAPTDETRAASTVRAYQYSQFCERYAQFRTHPFGLPATRRSWTGYVELQREMEARELRSDATEEIVPRQADALPQSSMFELSTLPIDLIQ